jgi:uncharacterized protein (TIGR03066 family)
MRTVKNRRERPEKHDDKQKDSRSKLRYRTWLVTGALFLVAGAVAYFALGWFLRSTLPDEIVGDWRIEGGEMNGTRVSFASDGTFKTLVTVDGKDVEVRATVQKHGNTLHYTMTLPDTRQRMTRTQTIKSLTGREMIVEEDREQSRLVRINHAK